MKVVVGSDHAGFSLKKDLVNTLKEWGYTVEDLGPHDETSVDYPDFAKLVGEKVRSANAELTGSVVVQLGLLICGSGIGMSIAANKMKGVRAALCGEPYSASMARAHNNANVLCLGSRVVGVELAKATLRAFLDTEFAGGRHQNRIVKITKIEEA